MDIILGSLSVFFTSSILILIRMILKYNSRKHVNSKTKEYYVYCKDSNRFKNTNIEYINNLPCILLKNEETIFGRSKLADIKINDKNISRKHFIITIDNSSCTIIDCKSANGTFVNGKKIQKYRLLDQDIIRVGGTSIIFCQKQR